jgi:hypothetical protein
MAEFMKNPTANLAKAQAYFLGKTYCFAVSIVTTRFP